MSGLRRSCEQLWKYLGNNEENQTKTCSLKNHTLNHCSSKHCWNLEQAFDNDNEILATYCKFTLKKLTFGTFQAQTRNYSSERMMERIEEVST